LTEEKEIIASVSRWIEKAVIGLDLCPFAKSVYEKRQIHYKLSQSEQIDSLMFDLHQEILWLQQHPVFDTGLLIIPFQLSDFLDFNQMLDQADALMSAYRWSGDFQLASFHPHYQFADTEFEDRENWSNRSPYPILHVLRENSVERAVSLYPGVNSIPTRNIEKLESLGDDQFYEIFKTRDRGD
jgi:hypothetical protein